MASYGTSWADQWSSSSTSNVSDFTNVKISDTNYAEWTGDGSFGQISGFSSVFELPCEDNEITGIEIKIDGWAESSNVGNYFEVILSWDGGSSWTSAQRVPTSGALATSETSYSAGGETNLFGRVGWTKAELSSSNFRVKVTSKIATGDSLWVNYIACKIHYTGGNCMLRIAADADDGTEDDAGWDAITYIDWVAGNWTSEEFLAGLRFQNVTIPKNATIISATIHHAGADTWSGSTAILKIGGVDVDDFSGFDDSSNKPSTLWAGSLTTAQIDYDETSQAVNVYKETSDIKTIIQELIDRAGWTSGNDIGIIINNDGATDEYIDSFDYGNDWGAAYLDIEYSTVTTKTISAKANIGTGLETKTQTITAKAKILCISVTELVTPTNLSLQASPTYFVWEIPSCCQNRNIHAHVQIDKTDDTFGDLEKDLFSYRDSDFEYWDGGAWQTYPTTGVTSTYYGNQARVQISLTGGNKWWRVKGGVK